MQTFPYIEDYLELMAGYDHKIVIKLARYDIQIVKNMAYATSIGVALTDRQAELAVKLIMKYIRQFAKHEVDVSSVKNPKYRLTPRKVNRKKVIGITSDEIILEFPYETVMIDQITEQRINSKGEMRYDKSNKIWHIAMTEPNIEWTVNYGRQHDFIISDDLIALNEQILEYKKHPYRIELVKKNDVYAIENAPQSLIDHVEENIGLTKDNVIKLIDHAGTYGYTVNDLIFEQDLGDMNHMMRSALELIGKGYHIHITPGDHIFKWIFDYTELTGRQPICIYDPEGKIKQDITLCDQKDIVRFNKQGKTMTCNYNPYDVKIVYAEKIPDSWTFPVPLLLTTREMMYGGKKVNWTKNAEKIIYYCETKLRNY